MQKLDAGVISDSTAQEAFSYELIKQRYLEMDDLQYLYNLFRIYFQNPTTPASTILKSLNISLEKLVDLQRVLQEASVIADLWISLLYPRSLLMRYAYQLTRYLHLNPEFLSSAHQDSAQPHIYMLEIHPTNGLCIYACKMCLWCGGGQLKARQIRASAGIDVLPTRSWISVLDEAKDLGVERIIVSGGGETLLDQVKFREVVLAAVRNGIEVLVYTNGRLLSRVDEETLDVILHTGWLRVSCHAATSEVYARLVNRPVDSNDFQIVQAGVRRLIERRNAVHARLKVGLGTVLQEVNFSQLPLIVTLCENLGVDFLDLRADCIGISQALKAEQSVLLLNDLRVIRGRYLDGGLPFHLTIADDLQFKISQWSKMELTPSKRCWIPFLRPAIDPFGTVCACDSIGEPYTRSVSPAKYVFGSCRDDSLRQLISRASQETLGVWCQHCMPGQVALNALFEKIVADFKIGIRPCDQPFFHRNIEGSN
jgi:MoaA/NifB/PqqE/SkfB family radical SAM enzyme